MVIVDFDTATATIALHDRALSMIWLSCVKYRTIQLTIVRHSSVRLQDEIYFISCKC